MNARRGSIVRLSYLLGIWLLTANLVAHAATLQISPVMVDLQSSDSASGIALRNPGDSALYGQVRVFRWEQSNGNDTLTPTQELMASPPLVRIAAQTDQLVRLVRATASPVPTARINSTSRANSATSCSSASSAPAAWAQFTSAAT